MDYFEEEPIRYYKKSSKKTPKKSDHKHNYKVKKEEKMIITNWIRYIEVCTICGKENERIEYNK